MNQKSRIAAGSAIAVVVVIGVTSCLAATNPSSSPAPTAASSSAAAVSTVHNHQDMYFAQMMSVHHQGAIDMSVLAPDRARSDAVKTLAVQIQEAQGPEIQQMQGWLKAWSASMASPSGSAMPGMSMPASAMPSSSSTPMPSSSSMPGMDMSGSATGMDMPGMGHDSPSASASIDTSGMNMPGMTAADMANLRKAKGAAFDKLFLKLMIVHHQAAVDMAKTEILKGTNPQALSLAADIISSQTAEIGKMQTMLTTIR